MGDQVLVTGAAGFVASHAIDQLLRQGYRVRGTVRSLTDNKQERLKPIRRLGQDSEEGEEEVKDHPNLELVEADLAKPDGWAAAVEGCKYVLHIACVNPSEKGLKPAAADKIAVDGTLNVLRACAQAGDVKRVVMTGSLGNVTFGHAKPPNDRERFNEEDWVDPKNPDAALMRAKVLAERAAWDFMKSGGAQEKEEKKEEEGGEDKGEEGEKGEEGGSPPDFDLVVLHPGLIIGPLLTPHVSVSVQILQSLLKRDMMLLPRLSFAISDVRDVAHAHIVAMTSPEVSGKRVITAQGDPMWLADMAKVLNEDFKRMDYCVPEYNAPYPLLWLVGRFQRDMRMMLPIIGCEPKYDNTRMTEELGVTLRDPKETILDTAYSLFETGNVPKPKKYRPRGEEPEVETKPEVKEETPVEKDDTSDVKDVKEKVAEVKTELEKEQDLTEE